MEIEIFSFGHKYGTPPPSDVQLDARSLPNPYNDPALRVLNGMDEPVKQWFKQFPQVNDFITHVSALVQEGIDTEGRKHRDHFSYKYRIGFGCTGGHHRSVYCAERLALALRANMKNTRYEITVNHTQHPAPGEY